jgi:hypothetical protein
VPRVGARHARARATKKAAGRADGLRSDPPRERSHFQRCPASITKAELAMVPRARTIRKACALKMIFMASVPPHPGSDGKGQRRQQRQRPGEARQVRLHNVSFSMKVRHSRIGSRAVSRGDPWLCVPASRRVCPGRSVEWRDWCPVRAISLMTSPLPMTRRYCPGRALGGVVARHRASEKVPRRAAAAPGTLGDGGRPGPPPNEKTADGVDGPLVRSMNGPFIAKRRSPPEDASRLPAHAGADGEGHRSDEHQRPGEARQVRLH